MITKELLEESLKCPVAFKELLRQFTDELTDEQRLAWVIENADDVEGLIAAAISEMEAVFGTVFLEVFYGYTEEDFEKINTLIKVLYNYIQATNPREGFPATYEELIKD